MADVDLLRCVCAHGVIEGLPLRADGATLTLGPGTIAVAGTTIAGKWQLDLTAASGWLVIEATEEGCRASKAGSTPGAVPLYMVCIDSGETVAVRDIRRHCRVWRWDGRGPYWLDARQRGIAVQRIQGAVMIADGLEPYWTFAEARLPFPVGTVIDGIRGGDVTFGKPGIAAGLVLEGSAVYN